MNVDDIEVESREDGPNLSALNQVAVLARERAERLARPWLASTFAMAVYSPIVLAIHGGARSSLPLGATLAFVVLAVALGAFSVVGRRSELTDAVVLEHLRQRIDVTAWAGRMRFDAAQTAEYRRLPESEQRVLALSLAFERPYFKALIVTAGIAFLGLVHGLAAKSFDGVWPFVVFAFALHGWHYPRLAPLLDRGRKLQREAQEAAEVRSALKAATRGQVEGRRAARPKPVRGNKA